MMDDIIPKSFTFAVIFYARTVKGRTVEKLKPLKFNGFFAHIKQKKSAG